MNKEMLSWSESPCRIVRASSTLLGETPPGFALRCCAGLGNSGDVGEGKTEVFAEIAAWDRAGCGFATQPGGADLQQCGGLLGGVEQRCVSAGRCGGSLGF